MAAVTIASVIGAGFLLVASLLVVLRYRNATGVTRGRLQWLAWGAVVTATFGLAGAVLHPARRLAVT